MSEQPASTDEKLDRLEAQLSGLATTVSKGFEATHKDIHDTRVSTHKAVDDVLGVLDVMMTRIDDRFTKVEDNVSKLQNVVSNIQNQLDGIEKRLEISEDERLVMAHQLTQLHDWVERAAKRIDVKFAH